MAVRSLEVLSLGSVGPSPSHSALPGALLTTPFRFLTTGGLVPVPSCALRFHWTVTWAPSQTIPTLD